MTTYRDLYSTRETPQSEQAKRNQVQNEAGGYVFALDNWDRLHRFLILGSDYPTYYAGARKMTIENARAVEDCLNEDGQRTVDTIVEISYSGRAPSNDPALFALAMASAADDVSTRRLALDALPDVARIGTHLFHFTEYVEGFRGWGRLLREAVADWYNEKDPDRLAYQVVKYQQRDGWSHHDLLRLSKPVPPTPEHDAIFGWIAGKTYDASSLPSFIHGFEAAKRAESKKEVVFLINEYNLTREMVPTEFLNEVEVWGALLQNMPMHATVRNLGKMTDVGLLRPMSESVSIVANRLVDREYLQRSRVHPLSLLVALNVYQSGGGYRGSLNWEPVTQIVDALDAAFYESFGLVEPTNKRTMLALDVSGSMSWGEVAGMTGITPRVGSAAMALVTAATEPNHMFTAFSHEMIPVNISPRQRLDDVVNHLSGIRMGGTDCALPMLYALENGLEIDAFIVYTDSETWVGNIHPFQALRKYRNKMGIAARLVVVGMTSSGFTIADPDDGGMIDVVGFDTAAPNVISSFVTG